MRYTLALLVVLGCNPNEHIEKQAAQEVARIEAQVAVDTEKQYEIVKSAKGPSVDLCVQAGLVAAAYLQANDAAGYSKWNEIKAADCKAAGVPE